MARQRDSKVGHRFFMHRHVDPDPNSLYAETASYEQWNKLTHLYGPTNDSEVQEFLTQGHNFKIVDYLIKVHWMIAEAFQPLALRLELFQDPEIEENRHLVALIGVHLPSREELINILVKQQEGDKSLPPFDDASERLDRIIRWWLTNVPTEFLDIVYFDIFDADEGGL